MENGDEAHAMAREKGGGNRNREKGYKKGIIIYLFTHASPGTPASGAIKILGTLVPAEEGA